MNINLKYNIINIQKIILVIVGIGLYGNSLNNDFALDDTMMITENNFTKGGWEGLKKIFTTDAFTGFLGEGKTLLPGGRYRPLSQAIFNIYYTVFELNPFGLHLLNLLLFTVSILLLFKVLRNIFETNKTGFFNLAFIATMFYAVHPLNTEVVANIKSMDLILSMIFSFLALLFALKFIKDKKIINLLWITVFFFLSLLSKETTITFLAVIPLVILLFKKPGLNEILFPSAILILVSLIYIFLRHEVIGFSTNIKVNELLNNPFLEANNTQKYATIIYTWLIYIKLIIIPYPLTHDYYPYVIELKNWTNPFVIFSAGIFLWGGYYSIKHVFLFFKKKQAANIISFGFMFFVIVFSISSNLLFNIGAFMNERFVYIADIGFFIIIAKLLLVMKEKYIKTNLGFSLILLAFFIPYSALTITRNPVWKNDYTLFRTDVKVSKNSAKCTVSAGGKTLEAAQKIRNKTARKKLLLEAKSYVSQGLNIHPKYFQAWELLGNINYELGAWEEALIGYKNCLLLSKSDAGVLNNLRNLAIKSREANSLVVSDKAIKILLKHRYQISNTLFIKSLNLEKENKIDSALTVLNSILVSDSLNEEALNKLGQMYGQYKNDFRISEYYLLKAYEIAPTNPSILENLGTLYAITQETSKALYFFKESYKINPNNKQIYQNISNVYRSMGELDKAIDWEKKGHKIK